MMRIPLTCKRYFRTETIHKLNKLKINYQNNMCASQFGYVYQSGKSLLTKEEVTIPEPTGSAIVLKVRAAGLCSSDVHILNSVLPLEYPNKFIMGHEIAGEIYKLGPNVDFTKYSISGRYAVHGVNSCGDCEFCKVGAQNLCTGNGSIWYGLGKSGGYEQYVLVKGVHDLIKIPEGVTFEEAAVASDAVLTPYHAISTCNLKAASRVLVIGCGGLGSSALQIIKLYSSYIVCVDSNPDLAEIAKQYGADEFYTDLSKSDIPRMSFDFVFDFVAIQPTFNVSQEYVKNGGIIKPVGLGAPELKFNLVDLGCRDVKIIGSFWGTQAEQKDCMKLIQRGLVKPLITSFTFDDFPKAYELLSTGKSKGRLVISQ